MQGIEGDHAVLVGLTTTVAIPFELSFSNILLFASPLVREFGRDVGHISVTCIASDLLARIFFAMNKGRRFCRDLEIGTRGAAEHDMAFR